MLPTQFGSAFLPYRAIEVAETHQEPIFTHYYPTAHPSGYHLVPSYASSAYLPPFVDALPMDPVLVSNGSMQPSNIPPFVAQMDVPTQSLSMYDATGGDTMNARTVADSEHTTFAASSQPVFASMPHRSPSRSPEATNPIPRTKSAQTATPKPTTNRSKRAPASAPPRSQPKRTRIRKPVVTKLADSDIVVPSTREGLIGGILQLQLRIAEAERRSKDMGRLYRQFMREEQGLTESKAKPTDSNKSTRVPFAT